MIDRIKKYGLCLGCGLCESVLGRDTCRVVLNEKGFYEPELYHRTSKKQDACIRQLCPGIHVETIPHKGVWGQLEEICQAWSSDEKIRFKAASGGAVTSLAIYLIEGKKVDAVLQVGVRDNDCLHNELKVSRTKNEVLENAQSRYAPVPIFVNIKDIFENTSEKFAFVGKPCDIAGMKNFCEENPQYADRVLYYISIFCAGMPSFKATEKTWKMSGRSNPPKKLRYRGEGWPGNFTAEWEDGFLFQLSYNESWGKILGKNLPFRCKICPDGIGMLADVSVGDSWNTKDGYPDFTESKGRSFCMVRNARGVALLDEAVAAGYLIRNDLDVSKIKQIQAYQYERRKLTGWRIIPVQFFSGFLLKFRGLNIIKQACSANVKKGVQNMIGTFKRMLKS